MNFILNNEGNLTVISSEGCVYNVSPSHLNYKALVECVKKNDEDMFIELVNVKESFSKKTGGRVTIDKNDVYYNGKVIHNSLTDRMLQLLSEGFSIDPWILFMEKLYKNTDKRAVEESYNFLEYLDLVLTPGGDVLAFKALSDDYYSIHAGNLTLLQGKTDSRGRILNKPGETIECPRNEVCSQKEIGCSVGLHVGNLDYAKSFGSKLVVVQFSPEFIVSIPQDCSFKKCRVNKYTVLCDYKPLTSAVVSPSVLKLVEDQAYEFTYKNEIRRAVVLEKHPHFVHCRCLVGDKSEKSFRNFDIDKISNVKPL